MPRKPIGSFTVEHEDDGAAQYQRVLENQEAINARVLHDSKQFCETLGLDTREKQMEFIRQTLKNSRLLRGAPVKLPREREPGEDSPEDIGHE